MIWQSIKKYAFIIGGAVGGALAAITGGAMEVGGTLLSLGSAGLSAGTGILSFMMIAEKTQGIGRLTGALKSAGSGLFRLGKSLIMGIPAMISWAGTVWAAAAAHIAAAWPIYAIVGGIALLGAGIFLLIKHWRAITSFMKTGVVGAFTFVKNAIVGVWQWFGKLADNPLIAAAGVLFAPFIAIPALIFKYWEPIKNFFSGLFGTIGKVIGAVSSFFGGGDKKQTAGVSIGTTSARTGLPFGGARAMGGAVNPGYVYKVGERGVEHFVPEVAGRVVSNRTVRDGTQASTTTQNVNVHIDTVRMGAPRDVQQMLDFFKRLAHEFQLA